MLVDEIVTFVLGAESEGQVWDGLGEWDGLLGWASGICFFYAYKK